MNIQTTRHITLRLTAALALLAMLALSACSSDDSPSETDSQSVVVVFRLSIPRTEAATTRTTTEGTAAGNELEHRLSKLHVALYDQQGQFIAQEHGLRITSASATTSGNYEYTANVEVSMVVPETYRTATPFVGELVVYANTDIPASESPNNSYVGTGISDLTFELSSNTAPDALPMWGMRNITQGDDVKLTAGTRNDLTDKDPIDLMRSVAKVTVDLTQEMKDDGWTFEELSLTHYNQTGYVLPNGYFSQNGVNSYEFASATDLMAYYGDNKDNNSRFRAYSTTEKGVNSGALANLQFNNGTDATAGLPVYIPEYDNKTGVTPATIQIKLMHNNVSEGQTYELQFARYDSEPKADGTGDFDQVKSGTEFNIVRNTWYQYHVYKLSQHKIGVTLEVKPWYYVVHDPIVM